MVICKHKLQDTQCEYLSIFVEGGGLKIHPELQAKKNLKLENN